MTRFRQDWTTSFLLVGSMHILGIPVSLLSSIVVARILGPEAFGQYAFVMALIAFITLPVIAGLPQLLTREVAAYSDSGQWELYSGIKKSATMWVLVFSVAVLGGMTALKHAFDEHALSSKWDLLSLGLLLIPLHGFSGMRKGLVKGLGYPAMSELSTQVVQPLAFLICVSLFAIFGTFDVRGAILMQVFAGLVGLSCIGLIYIRVHPSSAGNLKPVFRLRDWLLALMPFSSMAVVATLNTQCGILLLGLLGSDEAVGALRVGERGAQFVSLSLVLVNIVIAPKVVKIYRRADIEELQSLSRQSARAAFLIALPIGLVLIAFGKQIITVTFGHSYAEIGFLPMVVLILGHLFNVGMGSVGILLSMTGHEKYTLLGQIVGLLVTVVLALIMIPRFEALGAAMAATGGLVVWNLIMARTVCLKLKMKPGVM